MRWQARPTLDLSRYPSVEDARNQLRDFADETLGASHAENAVRIMMTMPSEAATDPATIDRLLGQGMSLMRVNCAHDGPPEWTAVIAS